MSDHYDAARDSYESWRLAIASLREMGVRNGSLPPRGEHECRQAAAGPVPPHQLDAVRCA